MTKPEDELTLDPEAEASIEQIAEGLRRYLRILLQREKGSRRTSDARKERENA